MNVINVYMYEHRLPSIMWVGLIQSAEGLNRTKRLASLSKRKFSNRLPLDLCEPSSLLGLEHVSTYNRKGREEFSLSCR